MNITTAQADLLAEVLVNSIEETSPLNWSDYEAVLATFRSIAPAHLLNYRLQNAGPEETTEILAELNKIGRRT